jgi:hypothetical protein
MERKEAKKAAPGNLKGEIGAGIEELQRLVYSTSAPQHPPQYVADRRLDLDSDIGKQPISQQLETPSELRSGHMCGLILSACIFSGSNLSQDIDWRYSTICGYTATNWRKI